MNGVFQVIIESIEGTASFFGKPANFPEISTIALTFLAVTVPVFIFAVTLLGNAITRAKQEEERAKVSKEREFALKINDLQNKIKALKVSGDSTELEKQLSQVKTAQGRFSREVKYIRRKYSRLKFTQCVLIPGGLFLASAVFSLISKLMTFSDLFFPTWLLSVSCLGLGIYRLSLSLLLVEEISASSEELQAKRMSEAFKTGMLAFEREREDLLQTSLKQPSSPYTCRPNSEFEMTVKTILIRGKIGRRLQVWFFVPDGFVLTEPDEKKVYRQQEDFAVPLIRTVRREAEDLQKNMQNLTTMKLVAPGIVGKYNILYEARAEGCVTPRGILVVNVTDK